MSRADELAEALAATERRLDRACAAAGRPRAEITLIAVSKTRPASDVQVLRELGVTDFGENRDAEAAVKAAAVPDVRWHFVGQVQSRKARSVATYADVVHSVDRLRLVQALGAGATAAGRVIDVLLQASLDGDTGRGGAPGEALDGLADAAADTPGLRLRGVMAVAPQTMDATDAFTGLAALAARLRQRHPGATAISAGMSADLEAAVAAGATHLRIGTALFGGRPAPLR